MVSLIAWNYRGFCHKLTHLKSFIADHLPAAITVQETFLKPANTVKIRRYSCRQKHNDLDRRVSGGAALLIFHAYPSSVVALHTPIQGVAVNVHLKS